MANGTKDLNDGEIYNLPDEIDEDNIPELDEDVDDVDDGTEDVDDSEDLDDLDSTADSDEDSDSKKNVPVKKYVEEKKKRQESEKKLADIEAELQKYRALEVDKEILDYEKSVKDKWLKAGYTEEMATLMAESLVEQRKLITTPKATSMSKYQESIATLKQTGGDYYDNVDVYKEKIEATMIKFEKLGEPITAQAAYNMVVDPITRQKELAQRQVSKGKPVSAVSPTVSSSSAKSGASKSSRLTKEDYAFIREMQKSDPTYKASQYEKDVYG